jgi:hypothetical protein
MNERTLVLGAAVGYTEAQVKPFLTSLRRAGYRGDVVLLASAELARNAEGKPAFTGVRWLPVRQWLPVRLRLFWQPRRWLLPLFWYPLQFLLWLSLRLVRVAPLPSRLRTAVQRWLATRLLAPTESRFIHFLDFLERHDYGRVLVTDVRDVLFQGDPFVDLPRHGLAVSMEDPQFRIGTESFNAGWVRAAFGEAMLRRLAECRVSCSGVTYGDRAVMLRYLVQMVDEILSLGLAASGRSGVDQGVHNVLLWTGRLGVVTELATLGGPVATLGGVCERPWRLDPDGKLLNRDGSMVSVVHQYDRDPQLAASLLRTLTS